MTFIGVGADVQIAAYTLPTWTARSENSAPVYLKQHTGTAIAGRQRELIRHSYYLGAISTINRLLQDQKRQLPVSPGVLAPVKEGLIRKAMNEMGPIRQMHSRRSYINTTANNQGQTDGQQVSIHKGVEQAQSSRKSLRQQ